MRSPGANSPARIAPRNVAAIVSLRVVGPLAFLDAGFFFEFPTCTLSLQRLSNITSLVAAFSQG